MPVIAACTTCFNTQPPEGGWQQLGNHALPVVRFNTQPPEGGWDIGEKENVLREVSTHSRLKAAGVFR
mgnify:CR=1 FL=1